MPAARFLPLRRLSLRHRPSLSFSSSRSSFSAVARSEYSTQQLDDAVDGSADFNDPPLASDSPSYGDGPEPGMPAPEEGPKLYVGNLPWTCNSSELAELFQKAGTVEMVEVIYDRETERSRGFGFVTMSTMEDARAAMETFNGADYGGRTLRVNFPDRSGASAGPRPPREDNPNKLFVGNLPWGIDDGTLEQLFSEHGKVVEARIVYDRDTGRSRGFGFVTMSSEQEVNEVINKMDGMDVEGRSLRVNLAGNRPPPRRDFF